MPLTDGFIGKFVIFNRRRRSELWALLIVLVLTNTIGLYCYTRLIVVMYVRRPEELALAGAGRAPRVAAAGGAAGFAVLAALTIWLIVFGVYPARCCGSWSTPSRTLPWP